MPERNNFQFHGVNASELFQTIIFILLIIFVSSGEGEKTMKEYFVSESTEDEGDDQFKDDKTQMGM